MLETQKDYCPYCGEFIELVIDPLLFNQEYVEDCSVCCRPILIIIAEGFESYELEISLKSENE